MRLSGCEVSLSIPYKEYAFGRDKEHLHNDKANGRVYVMSLDEQLRISKVDFYSDELIRKSECHCF